MVHAISDENDFNTQLDAAGDKLVVVDFHATWCGPCKMIAPFFTELSEEFQDVVFLKVDVDEVEEIAGQYKVTNIPKFVFIKNKNQPVPCLYNSIGKNKVRTVAEMLGTDQDKLKNLVTENK